MDVDCSFFHSVPKELPKMHDEPMIYFRLDNSKLVLQKCVLQDLAFMTVTEIFYDFVYFFVAKSAKLQSAIIQASDCVNSTPT